MTVDIHCHYMRQGYSSKGNLSQPDKVIEGVAKFMGKPVPSKEFWDNYWSRCFDLSGKDIVRSMDENGISRRVLVALDNGLDSGKIAIERQNQDIAEVVKECPDRLTYFCGVSAKRKNAPALLRQAVLEWGAKGLKLHPPFGQFYPDDEETYPLLKVVGEFGLPVLTHTGQMPGMGDYGHPSRLQKVLSDFPDLAFIAAHLGWNWRKELNELARPHPNLMCDISAFQATAEVNYPQFCYMLRSALDAFGSERVLFGTDGPTFGLFVPDKKWVELISNLPEKAPPPFRFTREEVNAVLHGNGERVLGLSTAKRR